MQDLFKSRDVLKVGNRQYIIFRLDALEKAGLVNLSKLPFSIRIVLEAALRQCNDNEITQNDVKNIAGKVEKLIDATGDSAKKLASEIKTDVKKLVAKLEPKH